MKNSCFEYLLEEKVKLQKITLCSKGRSGDQKLEPFVQKVAEETRISNPLLKSLLERQTSRTLCSKGRWRHQNLEPCAQKAAG